MPLDPFVMHLKIILDLNLLMEIEKINGKKVYKKLLWSTDVFHGKFRGTN